ncbi:hypothetical protein D3C78_1772680 [compost metagenome]
MGDGVHRPVRAVGVEPAVHPGPVIGMNEVFPQQVVDAGELLLPDMGPGPRRRHPGQLPVANAGHVGRHSQQVRFQGALLFR